MNDLRDRRKEIPGNERASMKDANGGEVGAIFESHTTRFISHLRAIRDKISAFHIHKYK